MKKASSVLRVVCLFVWLAVLATGVGTYLIHPQALTAENIAEFLFRFQGEIWLVYLALSVLRGFTLLPSTPLVIAGTILYPQQPFIVLFISLLGILLSSSMIYFFSDFLGFTDYFDRKQPRLTHKIKFRLEKPTGLIFVFLWAFFPFVPTDAVCYVAGTTKMAFPKFIAAVFFGELVLCCLYVFFGGYLMTFSG